MIVGEDQPLSNVVTNPGTQCDVGYIVVFHIERAEYQCVLELNAKQMIEQKIAEDQLVLHADRGSSMKSKVVAQLLSDLGVTKTHSRPHVSNDNPFSESQFKTMKYRPEFPSRFGCIEDARAFAVTFFNWYNQEHELSPHDRHPFQHTMDYWKSANVTQLKR